MEGISAATGGSLAWGKEARLGKEGAAGFYNHFLATVAAFQDKVLIFRILSLARGISSLFVGNLDRTAVACVCRSDAAVVVVGIVFLTMALLFESL